MSQQGAILHLLRERPRTTNELIASPYALCSEYRSRIAELRGKGYDSQCDRRKGGESIWTLVSEPPKVGVDGQLVFV